MTTGSFEDLVEATTAVSKVDGSAAFQTGTPVAGSTPSKITFTNAAFTDVGAGEPIQIGLLEFTNGRTTIGSGARTATLNLGLVLTSGTQVLDIGTITFHIDHTPNFLGSVPDRFSATFAQHAPVWIQDHLVQFQVNVTPLDFELSENATILKSNVALVFAPVPEPSTYAALIAALSFAFVTCRRIRGRQSGLRLPAAA